MCIGKNCARQVVSYVNAQLTAQYETSCDCLNDHKPHQQWSEKSEYSHALREFTYPVQRRLAGPAQGNSALSAESQSQLRATFNKPELDFICNHNVVLRLTVQTATFTFHDTAVGKDRTVKVDNAAIAFRIPFCNRRLAAADLKYNNGQNPLQFIVLDFLKADFVSVNPVISDHGSDAFTNYLKNRYLPFLAESGNHVFCSIPRLDDDRYHLTIDYSTIKGNRESVGDQRLHGISTDKINQYLSFAWLKAKLAILRNASWTAFCLADYRGTGGQTTAQDMFFHLHMHSPQIQPLCSQEAILYFSVDKVLFYKNADFNNPPRRKYSGWKIAVVANINIHKECEDCVTRCTLDLSSGPGSARPASIYCTHDTFSEEDELVETYWAYIVQFLSTTYLRILKSVNLDVVYHFDTRWPIAPPPTPHGERAANIDDWDDEKEGGKATSQAATSWRNRIKNSVIKGFKRVVVTAQSALNHFFRFLWSGATSKKHRDHALVEWRYKNFFEARLLPLTLRLLSGTRAIVWVHLKDGSLNLLGEDHKPSAQTARHDFKGWDLAFEVKLKTIVHSPKLEESPAWAARFRDSRMYKEHGGRPDWTIEYITLGLGDDPELLLKYSAFNDLQPDNTSPLADSATSPLADSATSPLADSATSPLADSADKVLAVVEYLKYYFVDLTRSGLNILQAIPVRKSQETAAPPTTSITVKVQAPGDAITQNNWMHASGSAEPVIAIGIEAPSPAEAASSLENIPDLPRPPPGSSSSTIMLSRADFLDKYILDKLNTINAQTALIPQSIHCAKADFDLITWENKWKTAANFQWEEAYDEKDDKIEYIREHCESLHSKETNQLDFTVSCNTRNVVQFPVATRTKHLKIKIFGETTLSAQSTMLQQESESKCVARWETIININTKDGGLEVRCNERATVNITSSPASGSNKPFLDLEAKLRAQLPERMELGDIYTKLKTFEAPWTQCYIGMQDYRLAYPVFNRSGDIVFELCPRSAGAASESDPNESDDGMQNGGASDSTDEQASSSESSGIEEVQASVPLARRANVTNQSNEQGQSGAVNGLGANTNQHASGGEGTVGKAGGSDVNQGTPGDSDDADATEEEY